VSLDAVIVADLNRGVEISKLQLMKKGQIHKIVDDFCMNIFRAF